MSSFEFMKQDQDKFASHRVACQNKAVDVTEDYRLERIRTASATKSRKVMDECTKQAVQKKWSEIVTTKLGFQDYNAFVQRCFEERETVVPRSTTLVMYKFSSG